MNIYYELLQYPVFSIKEVESFYSNRKTAQTALGRLLKKNMAVKIRNGLYTCISGENGGPVANKFQIASSINESSYVSHHSAFEYYGVTDQVYYDVYVSSDMRFHDFIFDGYTYHYVKSTITDGVVTPQFGGNIKVTDKERTVIDSIKDMNQISGLEETITCVTSFKSLTEKRLFTYLEKIGNMFLYQKTGFIFETYQNELNISNEFLEACKNKVVNSKRYLINGITDVAYSDKWKLVYPKDFKNIKNG